MLSIASKVEEVIPTSYSISPSLELQLFKQSPIIINTNRSSFMLFEGARMKMSEIEDSFLKSKRCEIWKSETWERMKVSSCWLTMKMSFDGVILRWHSLSPGICSLVKS